jgi:hypothetical protein
MAKGRKTGGRQKGTPNKDNQPLKEMILQALANAGGAEYLTAQSLKNPTAFMTLVGRVLPLQVKDGGAEPTVPTVVNHHYETK